MHEDLIQKISRFLDDELPEDEALSLLQKMRIDSELADKMRRYETVSHAIKNDDLLVAARPDFVSSVSSRIQLEPTYLIPNAERRWIRNRRFTRPQKIAAAAASVAVIALVAHLQRPEPAPNQKMVVAAIKSSAVSTDSAPAPKPVASTIPRASYPVNRQISDYLQAHSSIYTQGEVGFHPYAQVTQYSQK
ncbi:sigma-E factor negative regulatory protein [Candidatus Methylomicrobium oryzae]|jgi:sigma-E factor negative regulatory protein RseA|uniref:sigma-E factor negative regulatory protein n=1 Tax=Candidatus Methylomicrobium oryzae TaxID=2802053 RepID=UPI0019217F12|nr:sigma-E factor negative regulatory protein [Methylomicrobium sp. RS1]MBL1265642.1 sigma-E factor negative regulatory protein [Methylomicrobium sp. RS1]